MTDFELTFFFFTNALPLTVFFAFYAVWVQKWYTHIKGIEFQCPLIIKKSWKTLRTNHHWKPSNGPLWYQLDDFLVQHKKIIRTFMTSLVIWPFTDFNLRNAGTILWIFIKFKPLYNLLTCCQKWKIITCLKLIWNDTGMLWLSVVWFTYSLISDILVTKQLQTFSEYRSSTILAFNSLIIRFLQNMYNDSMTLKYSS